MTIGHEEHTAGDIVTNAFRGWFDNFMPVLIVSLMFTIPIFILNAIVLAGLPDPVDDLEDLEIGSFLARSLGASIVSIVLSVFLTVALTYAFMKIYRGEQVVPGESVQAVMSHLGPVLVFAVLSAILTSIGLLLLIIPGIIALIAFSLGPPSILNENQSGTGALSRCFNLIAGNWGVVLGVVLIGLVINIIASFIVGGIAVAGSLTYPDFSDFSLIRTLIQVAASAVLAPVVPALATALYFEVKGRNEGFPSL